MAEWHIQFDVDAKSFEKVMDVIHRLPVTNRGVTPVASGRGKGAGQTSADVILKSLEGGAWLTPTQIAQHLKAANFSGATSVLYDLVKQKIVRKVKGKYGLVELPAPTKTRKRKGKGKK